MKTNPFLVAIALFSVAAIAPLPARAETKKAAAARAALIAEGQRIVENVALCTDCHARRLPSGEFDRTHWLQGSVLAFQPLVKMPWSADAPAIAGLPGYTDEKAMTLLTTGRLPSGEALRPPMPAYRLNESEAKAVVAYLRSLAKP